MNVDVGISGEKSNGTRQGWDKARKDYECKVRETTDHSFLQCLTTYCDNVGKWSVVTCTFHSSLLYLISALFHYFFNHLSRHPHSFCDCFYYLLTVFFCKGNAFSHRAIVMFSKSIFLMANIEKICCMSSKILL